MCFVLESGNVGISGEVFVLPNCISPDPLLNETTISDRRGWVRATVLLPLDNSIDLVSLGIPTNFTCAMIGAISISSAGTCGNPDWITISSGSGFF